METRCIQITGGSSYNVTLPKKWVKRQGIQNKGIIAFHELDGGKLILWVQKAKSLSRGHLDITYLPNSHIVREMIGLYVSGVDEIEIAAKTITYEQRAVVRSVSYKLFGFELFDESSQQILLKNVATTTISVSEYCLKMVSMVASMFQDIIHVVETGEKKLAKDIVERDIEIDRIHLVILRQFNNTLYRLVPNSDIDLPPLDLHYYEHVAIRLERIADHIVRIASTIALFSNDDKVSLNKFEHAKLTKLHEYFALLRDILSSMDRRKAHQLIDLYDSTPRNEHISPQNITKSSINILISDSAERIRSYMANIAEETINYTNVRQRR